MTRPPLMSTDIALFSTTSRTELGERFADHRLVELEPAGEGGRHGGPEPCPGPDKRAVDRPEHSLLVGEGPFDPDEKPAPEILALLDRRDAGCADRHGDVDIAGGIVHA